MGKEDKEKVAMISYYLLIGSFLISMFTAIVYAMLPDSIRIRYRHLRYSYLTDLRTVIGFTLSVVCFSVSTAMLITQVITGEVF